MMSALVELIKETPAEDMKLVAKMLEPYLESNKEVPQPDQWISVKELRQYIPGHKGLTWLQLYIFPNVDWVTDPHPGRGRSIKINKRKAFKWLNENSDKVDWNRPLP